MNQEDLKKATELIDQSSSFGILLPEQPDFDTLAAAEALISSIATSQKVAGLLSPAVLPAHTDKIVFPKLAAPTPLLKEFIISVDTSHAPISQLRYEKADDLNRIDIILTPKLLPLDAAQVSFREGTIKCDCLIAIGVPNIEHLSNMADFPPDFFTENKLINIDIGDANMRYGEANIVDASRASRSELVWQMFSNPSDPANRPSADIGTLLLAGILSATQKLTAPHTTADTFAAVSELIRIGARHADAQKLAGLPASPELQRGEPVDRAYQQGDKQNQSTPLGLAQLCARASVRSKYDEENDILWSFLTSEDFTKTNRTPDDIPTVLDSIRLTLPQSRITALLWQEPGNAQENHSADLIRILLVGDRRILDAIGSKEETTLYGQHGGILLTASFPSFREAEDHVHALIRTAL
ncbi:MAG: hypothetical protein HY617_00830 [Candidatus Sungbacteria bacterium]|nr:hypothetical protein [Candidatus Sungbacteria bacterium]